jgi:Pentapeptide repeats (8 copies)
MLKRWASWPSGIRWLAGIAAVVLAASIVWALFVPLPDWLARHDVGSAKPALLQTARDAARGRLLTLAAGLFAAGALVFTTLNFNLSRRTFELTEQGQVTDRFTKAIEQLGSDKLDVRIGGIYALERVARDSAEDHPTVMEVLTAFIREHSREQWPLPDTDSSEQGPLTRPDVQAAVTVVGRRDAERDIRGRRVDLTAAHLARAQLGGAQLGGANLRGANLTGARLGGANLLYTHLGGANLLYTHLGGANLTDAHLTRADLTRADLTDANPTDANLTGADLTNVGLTDADLTGADLTGARWPEGARVPDGWMVDSDSGRLKRADQLSEVTDHYL